jgi:hypothetical protein
MDRYKIPANAARVSSPRGEFVLWAPAPSVLMQVAVGHGDANLVEQLARENARLIEGRRDVHAFFDGLAFTGYDTAFRTVLVANAREHLKRGMLKGTTSLLRSKLVAMGAAVVNLALGTRFEIVADVRAFDERLIAAGAGAILKDRPRAATG